MRRLLLLAALVVSGASAHALEACDSIVYFSGRVADCNNRTILFADYLTFIFFEPKSTVFGRPDRGEEIIRGAAQLFDRYRRIIAGQVPQTRLEADTVVIHVIATAPDAATEAEALGLATQRARVVETTLVTFGVPRESIALSANLKGRLLEPSDPESPMNRYVRIQYTARVVRNGLIEVAP